MINNFNDLKEEVKSRLNVVEVMSGIIDIDRNGKGICPFHNDTKKGNFSINPRTNRYKCFACGATGDALQFIQIQRGLSFVETVYQLGFELGLICEDECKRKKIMPNVRAYKELKPLKPLRNIERVEPVVSSKKELTDEDIELYDLVYRVFSKYCGLDNKDAEHLICERMVGSEKLNDFFSLRNVKEKRVIEKMTALLNKKGVHKEDIVKVPGFALNKNNEICLASYIRGIGMKIRNSQGKVIGIQVRTEIENKKYLWLSSNKKNGASSTTPPSIDYPVNIVNDKGLDIEESLKYANNSLLITEGKFKSISLANNYNCVSLGIAGINNWRNKVRKDFLNIKQYKDIENIVLYADADTCYNPQIFLQFKEMVGVELYGSNAKIYVAYWNIKHGKGIDDVLYNNNGGKVKYLKLDEYNALYTKYLIKTQGYNEDNKITDFKEEKTKIYNEIFNL